jgi:endonuclease-8
MAEGPVVHHYAERLAKVLEGRSLYLELRVQKLKPVEASLQGLKMESVEAHGKQFRMRLSDGRILLVHLMMWGSWRIYRKGAAWDKPRERARLIIGTDKHEAVVFSAPIVRVLTQSELESEPRWGNLGPDPLRHDFSKKEVLKRLNKQPDREIGEALLDQQVIAGVGNILKNEILFRAGIDPRRQVARLTDTEMTEIVRWTIDLSTAWLDELRNKRRNSWIHIYRKSGKPCTACGEPIEFFRQANRITYACPQCQK